MASLYELYRPTTLDKVYGNDTLKKDLMPFISGKRPLPNTIMFTGQSGCGKTTLARILAIQTGCSPVDIKEINAADFRGVDTIRELMREMHFAPLKGNKRVWIIDECAAITKVAQEAMLKALESPPAHAHFILCTTDPHLMLRTVLTRCTQFEVQPLDRGDLVDLMLDICEAEGNDTINEDHLIPIAKNAKGSPRAALSALERLLGRDADDLENEVDSHQEFEGQVTDLCKILLSGKSSWTDCASLVKNLLVSTPPETIRHAVLGYQSAVLLNGKNSARAAHVIECFKSPFYDSGKAGLVLACYYALTLE